jgi:hypothetical protein
LGTLEQYRASLESSRTWFLEHHGAVVQSFQVLDDGFALLLTALQVGRDGNDKTHISLAPLLMILQRQSFVALDALSSMQAYQAWVLVRPGLECALFMGKWMDDVANYQVWYRRFEDPQLYRRTFSGKALQSNSLPRSSELQGALKGINDSFAHPNQDYYLRHIGMTELESGDIEFKLRFFDEDSFHRASVLSLLHLLIVTQDSIARMFAARFVNLDLEPAHFGLQGFEGQQRPAARKAAATGATEAYLIRDLGLWDLEAEA